MRLPAPEDIRGMTVRDRHGLIAGRVAELYVDDDSGAPRYIGVAVGPLVPGYVLVPLEDAMPTADPLDVELRLPYTGAELRSAPTCAEGAPPTVGLEIEARRHFARAGARRVGGDEVALKGLEGADPASVRTVRWGT